MNLSVCQINAFTESADAVVIGLLPGQDPADAAAALNLEASNALGHFASLAGPDAKAPASFIFPSEDNRFKWVVLARGGESDISDAEKIRRVGGQLCGDLKKHKVASLVVYGDHAQHIAEAVVLGQYDYSRYKSKAEDAPEPVKVSAVTLLVSDEDAFAQSELEKLILAAQNVNWARDLGNTPGSDMTPSDLAAAAQEIANESDASIKILEEDDMKELGMNAILAVSKGSSEPAKMIILHHHVSDDKPTYALVGKGLTFDAGGISIKPSNNMHQMKFDMCGAAAVLGAMKTLCALKPNVNIVCAVPSSENLLGASALKPGDIIKGYNGKTIEVWNTDAEGRLILSDALAYVVDHYKPTKMVNAATLTGACIVALGHFAAAIMGTSETVVKELQSAADRSGDRVWPLPLWQDYSDLIKGQEADVCNMNPSRDSGTITAGAFLKHFVGDTDWVHVDVAGTSWGVQNVPYLDPKLATGFGVRLFTEWVLGQEGAS